MLSARIGWTWSCGSRKEDENVKNIRQRKRQQW